MDNIRPATAEDEAAVSQLWRDCGLTVSYNDPTLDFRIACDGPSSTVLVGLEGPRIVGTVMVGHDGHRGWLYYVACAPERQRSGIGRAMVTAAEHWLAERGIVKVQIMVRETNAQVTGFYERLGFGLTPRIVMAKWLKP